MLLRWLMQQKRKKQKGNWELAEKQLEIVDKARELMSLMTVWQDFAGKTTEEIVTMLMNIGLGHIQAIYRGQMIVQDAQRRRQAQLN